MDRQRLLEHKVRNGLQQLGLLGLLALLLGYLAWVVGGEPFLWGTLLDEAATAADELTPDTLPAVRSPGGRDHRDIPAGEYPLEFYRASPA